MKTALAPAYGDLVPNQPRTQNRTMRLDDPEWEGFGVFSEAIGSDRTKLVALFLEACIGRSDIVLPAPLPPGRFAELLSAAVIPAEAAYKAEADPRKRAALKRKHDGLVKMVTEVRERAAQQPDD